MFLRLISKISEVTRYLVLRYCIRNVRVERYLRIGRMCDFRVNGKLYFHGPSSISSGFMCGVSKNGEIHIGSNTYFGRNCTIVSHKKISIGDNTILGPNVMAFDHDHEIIKGVVSHDRFTKADVSIGSDCWIGAGVIILKGSEIGDGSIIGAGTVVKGNVPPKTIMFSNQEKVFKQIESVK